MDKDIAISVSHVSKTFKIPHEKVSSLRGAAVSVFKGNRGYEEFKALMEVLFQSPSSLSAFGGSDETKKFNSFLFFRHASALGFFLKIKTDLYEFERIRKN